MNTTTYYKKEENEFISQGRVKVNFNLCDSFEKRGKLGLTKNKKGEYILISQNIQYGSIQNPSAYIIDREEALNYMIHYNKYLLCKFNELTELYAEKELLRWLDKLYDLDKLDDGIKFYTKAEYDNFFDELNKAINFIEDELYHVAGINSKVFTKDNFGTFDTFIKINSQRRFLINHYIFGDGTYSIKFS